MTDLKESGLEEASASSFSFNDLKTHHVFMLTSIIGKIGISEFEIDEETKKALSFEEPMMQKGNNLIKLPRNMWTKKQIDADTAKTIAESKIVIRLITTIMKNMRYAEDDICELLADLTDGTVDKINDMKAIDFYNMLKEFVSQQGVIDFFMDVLKSKKETDSISSTMYTADTGVLNLL